MGEVIKVIDLLNMIADGEELPKRIKYDGYVFTKTDNMNYYTYFNEEDYITTHIMEYLRCGDLHDEVIILEDEEAIDIQSIDEIPRIIHINANDENVGIALNNIIEQHNDLLQAVKYLDNKLNKEYCQNCGVELTSDNKYMNGMCTECKYGED